MFNNKTVSQIMSTFTKTISELGGVVTRAEESITTAEDNIKKANVQIDSSVAEKDKAKKIIGNLEKLME